MSQQPFYPNIKVIEKSYEIPQLNRSRRVSAILPYDYYESDKKYRVLYLNDGQNLWDDDAPYGNWNIDKSLRYMASVGLDDVIIIAIDHGGNKRISEYAPYPTERFGESQGNLYIDFLINTLKPYIEKNFRVLPGRQNAGIGGSSMGALISLYAGVKYPEIYSKLLIFSPSLWIAPEMYEETLKFLPASPIKLYVYAGEHESKNHIANVMKLRQTLKENKSFAEKIKFKLSINPAGTHNEYYWSKEFPIALKWLYFDSNDKADEHKS